MKYFKLILLINYMMFLTACGGGSSSPSGGDTQQPVITLSGANPQVIEAGTGYVELGATANDNVDGDITANITINASAVNTGIPGSYAVTYDVSDAAGNAADRVTRAVKVVDATVPVITLSGANPQVIETGTAYVELGATANDNVDGDITANITINASAVNTGIPGSYAVTYDVSDAAGNAADQVTRTVNVEKAPNTIPVAHAGPDQVVRGIGSVVILDGSSSIDDDGDVLSYSWILTSPTGSAAKLSEAHIVKPTFTPDVNGTYIVRLRVNDGNIDSTLDTVAILYSSTAEDLSGGICLSFDDANIESWHAARGLFDKYNAKVTFSITWAWVASQDFSRLLDLKSDGHEIASHSLSHLDIDGVITSGGYGDASEVERYIHEEIDPAIELMAVAGLPPVTFAFPYNADNPPYTAALLEKFSFARGDAWVPDGSDIATIDTGYYTCSDHDNNRRHVNGFTGGNSIENLNAAMDHAAANNSVVLIYDHKILDNNSSENYGIKRAKLEAILSKAQEVGLKFYTTIELGKHCSE